MCKASTPRAVSVSDLIGSLSAYSRCRGEVAASTIERREIIPIEIVLRGRGTDV